jgi:glycosyltransferase involved in cell wall biosynthesis
MLRPKISIILPIRNAGARLQRCLHSVATQSLQDIEIICLDLASTDGSKEMVQEYSITDSRVKLISLSDGAGTAAARNHGIEQARGEYLGFVDSDYWPYQDFYAKLYAAAHEDNADVAKGNYRYWDIDGRSQPVGYWMNDAIRKHKINFPFAFCSAIYLKKFIDNYCIHFPEKEIEVEDQIFSLKIAKFCNKIAIVDDAEINIIADSHLLTDHTQAIQSIFAKFGRLSIILDIINNDKSITERSYTYIVAFGFHCAVATSVSNKSERAFRVIRDNLEMTFSKISNCEACLVAFSESGQSDLFTALANCSTTALSVYLMKYYDKNTLAIAYLKAKIQKALPRNEKVCIAVPIYIEQPEPHECASLRRCLHILGKYRIVFFGPENLNMSVYEDIACEYGASYTVKRFPDVYFTSAASYSKLMLNVDFYNSFSNYEYMLVYQLDSWVFRDELDAWCAKGYDYIGAPWFEGYAEADKNSALIEPSGNGGFSLRKISSIIRYLYALQIKIAASELNKLNIRSDENEDSLLLRVFPYVYPDFVIAPVYEAMCFSFEALPRRLYVLTGKLPFGCHGFSKYDNKFWKQHIDMTQYNAFVALKSLT